MALELYNKVGPAGVALVFLSGLSLYLALRNGVYLFMVSRDFRRTLPDIEDLPQYAQKLCENTGNPLVGIIAGVVQTHATHSKDIRSEVDYMFYRNFASVTRGLTYLRLISVIAPLLGLLGTVLGMVQVFATLASRAAADSASLAAGIWEALLTTIMGLCVAIPTLIVYYHLSLKMKGFRIEAVEHSYRAVEGLGMTCPQPSAALLDQKSSSPRIVASVSASSRRSS